MANYYALDKDNNVVFLTHADSFSYTKEQMASTGIKEVPKGLKYPIGIGFKYIPEQDIFVAPSFELVDDNSHSIFDQLLDLEKKLETIIEKLDEN